MTVYNVLYDAPRNKASVKEFISHAGEIVQEYDSLNILVLETFVAVENIMTIPHVIDVEENMITHMESFATDINDWHIRRMQTTFLPIPEKKSLTNGGVNATVYMIDGPVLWGHGELSDAKFTELYSIQVDNDPSQYSHGTAMASLIVGKNIGTAPLAKLKTVGIRMGIYTPIATILEALDKVLTDPERPSVSVLLCSWGVTKSRIIDTKIRELQSRGIVVVAASGNSGVDADTISPAGLDTVVGVGACDAFDRVISWGDDSQYISNGGPEVDIFAPAIDVTVAAVDSIDSYRNTSGTSIAAALVAGVVAQLITKYPTKTASEIEQELLNIAVPDVLFRDETLYSDTPNRLLQNAKYGVDDVWGFQHPVDGFVTAKKGTETTFSFVVKSPVVNANHKAFSNGKKTIVPLDWVHVSQENDLVTVRVTPPVNIATGKYISIILGEDSDGNKISSLWIRFGVYDTTVDELENIEEEFYRLSDETPSQNITITAYEELPFIDCCGTVCPKDQVCCSDTGEAGTFNCVSVAINFCC